MTSQQSNDDQGDGGPGSQAVAGATEDGRVFVVTPQAMAVEGPPAERVETSSEAAPKSVTEMVEQPAKVMRIGNMIRQLLDEVKAAPLDEASRARLATIHSASIAELKDGLAPELVEELDRIALPFSAEETPKSKAASGIPFKVPMLALLTSTICCSSPRPRWRP